MLQKAESKFPLNNSILLGDTIPCIVTPFQEVYSDEKKEAVKKTNGK